MVAAQEKKVHLISCPYGCGAQFPIDKKSLDDHIKICPKAPKTGETRSPQVSKRKT